MLRIRVRVRVSVGARVGVRAIGLGIRVHQPCSAVSSASTKKSASAQLKHMGGLTLRG